MFPQKTYTLGKPQEIPILMPIITATDEQGCVQKYSLWKHSHVTGATYINMPGRSLI